MVLYRGPLGDTCENPSDEFLQEIVNRPAEYWAQGGGDSCLEVAGSNDRMIFFVDEPYGVFVMMHPDYEVVAQASEKPIETVEHRVGGEPMKVPSIGYVSRERALLLMREFVKNAARPSSVKWIDMFEIEFDHGF